MSGVALGAGALMAWPAWRIASMRQCSGRRWRRRRIVVPLLFFASPRRQRIAHAVVGGRAARRDMQSTPPIVLIVFDEFPLHSLLDADGRVDQVRFPNFAALARDGVVVSRDHHGVVADGLGRARDRQRQVSGAPDAVPTLRYYPQNLFTLLADRYEMFLSSDGSCSSAPRTGATTRSRPPATGRLELLADLPWSGCTSSCRRRLTERLPPVVGDWQGFARAGAWRTVDGTARAQQPSRSVRPFSGDDGCAAGAALLPALAVAAHAVRVRAVGAALRCAGLSGPRRETAPGCSGVRARTTPTRSTSGTCCRSASSIR